MDAKLTPGSAGGEGVLANFFNSVIFCAFPSVDFSIFLNQRTVDYSFHLQFQVKNNIFFEISAFEQKGKYTWFTGKCWRITTTAHKRY